jgi:hypothetical protein
VRTLDGRNRPSRFSRRARICQKAREIRALRVGGDGNGNESSLACNLRLLTVGEIDVQLPGACSMPSGTAFVYLAGVISAAPGSQSAGVSREAGAVVGRTSGSIELGRCRATHFRQRDLRRLHVGADLLCAPRTIVIAGGTAPMFRGAGSESRATTAAPGPVRIDVTGVTNEDVCTPPRLSRVHGGCSCLLPGRVRHNSRFGSVCPGSRGGGRRASSPQRFPFCFTA